MIAAEPVLVRTSNTHFEILLSFLLTNTVIILTLVVKVGRNVNKARTLIHRQNWRVNMLWQERLESKNWEADPIEKELFGDHSMFK